ncbi:M16 family metallopeptidase [Ancylobacter pratisalsi]|uniref:Insulinase family protein n=1 Tax=Ancylobacter pratisalsi TaxID=1745854 RepID=A0A6P1YQ94_9HYPH|nr:pitrilysin family protein [Ancylobacter pratisalsi]QIB33894.1 insulinase family protein [Ancylobacter pratisalsi]
MRLAHRSGALPGFLRSVLFRPFLQLAAASLIMNIALLPVAPAQSETTRIQRVISPGGIEAWLVHDTTLPLVAMEIAFMGGASQDPGDKPGVANLAASLLDEGAGDLDSQAFQDRMAGKAIELRFDASRDQMSGSLRTLSENADEAFELMRLAVTQPRFDTEAVERIRQGQLASLRRRLNDPSTLASLGWSSTAFPNHPYGRPVMGTLESVPTISREDLTGFVARNLARDNLKIAVVGDITPEALAPALDKMFGALPARAGLTPVPDVTPQGLGTVVVKELDVPQTSMVFGGIGLKRNDPDFIPAFVLNHMLGGSAFSSRLFKEVREKRGLAYSVYSHLAPLDHAALILGGTATKNDRAGETIDIIKAEWLKLLTDGPSEDELADAKSYLIGSFALRFDSSAKVASQLLQIQIDELGIDYIDIRNQLVGAVTLDDIKRVAARFRDDPAWLFSIVGKPSGLASSDGG